MLWEDKWLPGGSAEAEFTASSGDRKSEREEENEVSSLRPG